MVWKFFQYRICSLQTLLVLFRFIRFLQNAHHSKVNQEDNFKEKAANPATSFDDTKLYIGDLVLYFLNYDDTFSKTKKENQFLYSNTCVLILTLHIVIYLMYRAYT